MDQAAVAANACAVTQHFSTAAFAPRDRMSVWRDLFGLTIARLELEPAPDRPLNAEATLCRMPGLGLVTMSSEEMQFRKPRSLIDNDDVILAIPETAGWIGSQMGREACLDPGDAALCSNSEVAVGTSAGRRIALRVPLNALAPMVVDIHATVMRRVPAETAALRLLRTYVRIFETPELLATPELQRLAVVHVYDLMAMLLGATRDAAETAKARGGYAARRHAVMAGIDQHLTKPELSAAWLGSKLGLSERYVHHLLAGSGLSFSEAVRSKRVDRARRMLERPSNTPRRIIDVAYAVGFSDLSTFNRAFRRQFGCTPSEILCRN